MYSTFASYVDVTWNYYEDLTNKLCTTKEFYMHSISKVKHGEENANFRKAVRIEEDVIHCRGRR